MVAPTLFSFHFHGMSGFNHCLELTYHVPGAHGVFHFILEVWAHLILPGGFGGGHFSGICT
jgi:hypothetical protein